ncbi:MAG: glycosyltransferase [Saprospiraceae bacterium]|nr:glycosyltransferase [Saprospiraceae bacterium]
MKSVVILSPAHPLRGGIASSSERLAQEFQQFGYSVEIWSFKFQYPGFLFPGKTQFSSDPAPKDLKIRTLIHSISPLNWLNVGRKLKKQKPDLIVLRYWLPFMGPALGSILRIARKNQHSRIICIADNIIPHEKRPGDMLFTRYFVPAVDAFIGMSKSVTEEIASFQPKGPIAFSPHPLYDNYGQAAGREASLSKLGLDPGFRYLLFFGFIRDYKGLDLLLDALADPRLAKLPIKLIVAGEYYSNAEKYEKQIETLGIKDRLVLHTRYIPNEDVRYYFGASDLVVQPYRSATVSGISQMAYFYEIPMVVTNVGGLPEIVPHGEAGYVTAVDPTEVASAVYDYFSKDRMAEFQEGVRKNKKRFAWSAMVETMEDLASKIEKPK